MHFIHKTQLSKLCKYIYIYYITLKLINNNFTLLSNKLIFGKCIIIISVNNFYFLKFENDICCVVNVGA